MRSGVNRSAVTIAQRAQLGLLVLALALTAACSKTTPVAPDARGPFLGTWRGTITNAVIGRGDATVMFNFQIGSDAVPLLNGMAEFRFPDNAFSWKGTVSAGLDPTRGLLGIFFERHALPCPTEPGGTAQRVMAAAMEFTPTTMHGDYVVAGCPGGTLELTRQ